ncbi:MAG: hypothetical protein COA91_10400 [Robiginitomaculum sp.]|nr:MAG: hypothetical protein COA91_10400 [Robiginitomaculum sp.]
MNLIREQILKPIMIPVFGLYILAFGASAIAKSAPDLSATWPLSCLDAYKDIVSTMNPAWIPDKLRNGFEIEGGEARLTSTPTVPWLTIYNKDKKPIYHGLGYNSRSDELWTLITSQNKPTKFAPTFSEIEPYTGLTASTLPTADFTFVVYYASWCTNCKLQENAVLDYKTNYKNYKITHIRIIADTAKMQKKKYTSQTCPVNPA